MNDPRSWFRHRRPLIDGRTAIWEGIALTAGLLAVVFALGRLG